MRTLITGAASGIGRATCVRLARDAKTCDRPMRIAAVDLGPSAQFDAVIDEARALGAEAMPVYGDMAMADAPARAVAEAVSRFGGLDALVSNAGVNRPGRAARLRGRGLGPPVRGQHASHVAARQGRSLGAYGPSKAALIMLARVMAQEFGRDGIRVNTVSPGMVRTGMTERVYADARIAAERDALVPLGRVATPEDMPGLQNITRS